MRRYPNRNLETEVPGLDTTWALNSSGLLDRYNEASRIVEVDLTVDQAIRLGASR